MFDGTMRVNNVLAVGMTVSLILKLYLFYGVKKKIENSL